MKIIESIEIHDFRSFIGSPQSYKASINDLNNLNIFSGSNDSGKSNILRALNLFFNNEISPGSAFEFNRDFCIGKMDSGFKVIEISITFNLSRDKTRDKFLPERFIISKFWDRHGFRNYTYTFNLKEREIRIDSRVEKNKNIKDIFIKSNSTPKEISNAGKREWNYRVKFSGFLNKYISFEYVPAIRDKSYFAHLLGRVITTINQKEDSRIRSLFREKDKIQNWDKTIKLKSEQNIQDNDFRTQRLSEIENELKGESKLASAIGKLESEINEYSKNLISSIDFLDSEFKIGNNLQEFFEGFDVGTGVGKKISFRLRGDGIQAKYVPNIF